MAKSNWDDPNCMAKEVDSSKLILAIRWREDVATGEMIEQRITEHREDGIHYGMQYTKDHLSFPSVFQYELDHICKVANLWWELHGSKLRITNSMGELIPATMKG